MSWASCQEAPLCTLANGQQRATRTASVLCFVATRVGWAGADGVRGLFWRSELGANPGLCQVQRYGAQYGVPPTNFSYPPAHSDPCSPTGIAIAPGAHAPRLWHCSALQPSVRTAVRGGIVVHPAA